ncbi:hypothetical protein M405DRAFT_882287 [Rhizopogon salebrosus TDB-379]|nr:hypothetical protein M405DRAFT_882287 [Rhizopogon salebrosus TDB-379]
MSAASTNLQTARVSMYITAIDITRILQLIWGWRWTVIRVTFIGVAMTTYRLLIFCTYAFWQQSKKVLICQLLILAAVWMAGPVGVTKAADSLNPPAPGASTTGYVLETPARSSAIQYAFLILFELALMILTVYERFHFYKDCHNHLVTTLYRDGLVYMACIIMASIANIFVGLLAPASYIAIMHASVNSLYFAGSYR